MHDHIELKWALKEESPRGLITGADQEQEGLLPWWWKHVRSHSDEPILFVDFGMSEAGRRFCEERGRVVTLAPPNFVKSRAEVPPERVALWETLYSSALWELRRPWFMKPLALLASPFEMGLWLDLDCLVSAPLHALFEEFHGAVAIAKEEESARRFYVKEGILPDRSQVYNSGVILFPHGDPFIAEWARRSVHENDRFVTEQVLLSAMLHEESCVRTLPMTYNWNMRCPGGESAVIRHFVGPDGKKKIRDEMKLLTLLGTSTNSASKKNTEEMYTSRKQTRKKRD